MHPCALRILTLPDIPRWVEARGYAGRSQVQFLGLREDPMLSCILVDPETRLHIVIGQPDSQAMAEAAARPQPGDCLIAPIESAGWLRELLHDWESTRARLHLLKTQRQLPEVPAGLVRWVSPEALESADIPDALKAELRIGMRYSPLAAAWVDHRPVSFCYAGAQTEELWDISIDTLEAYRRSGMAAACVTFMIHFFDTQGKRPVWGAVDENPASWRLAEKLGFEAVDQLVLFSPKDQ